jgi:hypothetical protein
MKLVEGDDGRDEHFLKKEKFKIFTMFYFP